MYLSITCMYLRLYCDFEANASKSQYSLKYMFNETICIMYTTEKGTQLHVIVESISFVF